MIKSYNFRIYPTKAQEGQIKRTLGCCRFVYNHFLAERERRYKENGTVYGFYEMCRDLTQLKKQEEYKWLAEADVSALQTSLKNLDRAFANFIKRVKQKNIAPGYPKFKSKRESRQSYTCKKPTSLKIGVNKVRLVNIGWIKCRVSKQVEGRILNATVIRSASGKYSVTLCFESVVQKPLPLTGAVTGLSFGLTDLITTSEGVKYKNNRYAEQSHKKIARLQRELSRKTKDSSNYEKARVKFARANEHVANQRKDALHKLTTGFVRSYDVICVRDEPVAKMFVNRKSGTLARLLSDASWGEIIRQLDYKCEWYGKQLIKVDTGFASSQLCGSCGQKNNAVRKDLRLSEWICPKCGTHHNRAINAAKNILKEGYLSLTG
jgi:putative transposase